MVSDKVGQIRHDRKCLTAGPGPSNVTLNSCYHDLSSQVWMYQDESKRFQLNGTSLCLTAPNPAASSRLEAIECDVDNLLQLWTLEQEQI